MFCVTDLLPHLSAKQNERPLKDGLKGEELNIVVGSLPFQDEEIKEPFKLLALSLLNERYGITEKDFFRAELELVPAVKARDEMCIRDRIYPASENEDSARLTSLFKQQSEAAVAFWVYKNRHKAGATTDTLPGAQARYTPVRCV